MLVNCNLCGKRIITKPIHLRKSNTTIYTVVCRECYNHRRLESKNLKQEFRILC